jgi:sialate O-acetylesterase
MEAAAAGSPLDSPRDGSWGRDTPENAQRFSAVGYEFGRELRATQDVPIGLIHASFGGTPVEGWLSPHAHASDPRLEYSRTQVAALMADHPDLYSNYDEHHQAAFEAFEQAREEWRARQRRGESNQGRRRQGQPGFEPGGKHLPSVLYNAMIHPFTPFAIRGVIWYQGEANTNYNREHYAGTMTALVEDWRRQWNQPDLPFLMVQLANIRAPQEAPGQRSHWAALRQAQLQVTRMAAGVRLATAIDLGDPDDLHPRNKLPLGRRLSLLARAYVYGEDALVSNGPIASQVVRDGDDLVIRFDSVGSGLRLMEGQTDVRGFELEIRPGSWVFVPGRITDTAEVRLSIPPGASAESVRYGWADNPILSLTNETGIPALPFELKLLY